MGSPAGWRPLALKVVGDELGRAVVSRGAYVAAFHVVAGESFGECHQESVSGSLISLSRECAGSRGAGWVLCERGGEYKEESK